MFLRIMPANKKAILLRFGTMIVILYFSLVRISGLWGKGWAGFKLATSVRLFLATSFKPHNHDIQPQPFCAPEVLSKATWTYSADIWNLGTMVWPLRRYLHKSLIPCSYKAMGASCRWYFFWCTRLQERQVFASQTHSPDDTATWSASTAVTGKGWPRHMLRTLLRPWYNVCHFNISGDD